MIDNDEARKTWDGVTKAISDKLIEASQEFNETLHEGVRLQRKMEEQAYFERFRGDEPSENIFDGCIDTNGHLWDRYKDMTTLIESDGFWRCRYCGEIRTTLNA